MLRSAQRALRSPRTRPRQRPGVTRGSYLNRADVKAALHAQSSTWQNADETGPVAEALAPDFVVPSITVVEAFLELGKEVLLYNGVRDGSVSSCVGL